MRVRMMRQVCLSIALLLMFLTGPVRAQFFLEEGKVTLTVAGGERSSGSMVLHNTSDEEVGVRAYWEDFRYVPPFDGNKEFSPAGILPGSASQWVSFTPQEFVLPPNGSQVIDYAVNAPADIKGGHYGVLFFERATPMIDSTGVALVTRLGCLFFVESKDAPRVADIKDVKAEGNDVLGSFVNQSDLVLIPKTTFYLLDAQGLTVHRGEGTNLYVAPGATGNWRIALPAELAPGTYSLVLNVDLGSGSVAVKEISLTQGANGLTIENLQ